MLDLPPHDRGGMMDAQFYTYLHCLPNGDPFYVGKGTAGQRPDRSRNFTRRNLHHKRIVAKYGKDNILVYVFPCASEAQAFADEIQQIAQLRSDGFELCNQTAGGDGASNPTAETRMKISIAGKGRVCSAQIRRNMSVAAQHRSAEARKRMSDGQLGNTKWLGRKHSAATKLKMSIAQTGRVVSARAKANMSAAHKGMPWSELRRSRFYV